MAPEERIVQLEAELLREREEKLRLMAMLEAALKVGKIRTAAAERQARYRARTGAGVTDGVTVTHNSDAHVPLPPSPSLPPPPLEGSPPPSVPSSPSPISSPPSSLPHPPTHEKQQPLRGQGELAVVAATVGRGGKVRPVAGEARDLTGGPVNQLRQQHAAVWAGAGRSVPLGLPVKRTVRAGENPVDFSREGQLWNQAIAHARVAGAADDAAAVVLVLERLKHAAHMLRSVNEGGTWVSRPKVLTLAEFVAAFHEAAEDPRERRGQPNIHSTAVSDWSEGKKHGEDGWTPSDEEVVQAMELSRKGASR